MNEYLKNQPYVITPRIFKSSTIELLEKAKKLYNSDKSPLSFMIKSNVEHSSITKLQKGEDQE